MDQITKAKDVGHEAWLTHGVTGCTKDDFPEGSLEQAAFHEGFSEERARAYEQALKEALAYHHLTISEEYTDRARAEKMFHKEENAS